MAEQALERIAVLDFGGQYAHLIAKRLRGLGVFAELHAPEHFDPARVPGLVGVVLSGGPRSVAGGATACVGQLDLRAPPVPVLGICYGHQLAAAALGGSVVSGRACEYGLVEVTVAPEARLFEGLPRTQRVWMSHGDHVERLPNSLRASARSAGVEVAAYEALDAPVFGLQFHPEVSHTEHGLAILNRFVALCGAKRTWNAPRQLDAMLQHVRQRAAGRRLLLLSSGGVDSLVCLALCVRAIGAERVYSLHVDTGFMRENESREVADALGAAGFGKLEVVDAEARFLERLRGVADPEEKRAHIGALFVEVLREQLARLGVESEDWLLVQGTIYPDTIESGGEKAAKIKTHHNRVPEIARLMEQGRVLEPLAELYKDEVRELGRALGLPAALVERHPFPGPGLAIRLLVSDGGVEADFDREEAALRDALASFGLDGRVLPVRSVGVQGDSRTYRHPLVVWPADGRWPGWELLTGAAAGLVNRFSSINRVVLSLRPLVGDAALSLREARLEKASLDRLRHVDALVRSRVTPASGAATPRGGGALWQLPVVALPLFDSAGRQAFVVRPVCSEDAMTARVFEMPPETWRALEAEARRLPGVAGLLYDLTTKPPGTIEWE